MSFSGTGGRVSDVRAAASFVGEGERPLPHLRPVFDRLADIGEHPLQLAAEFVAGTRVPDRIDLDPHPALHHVAVDRVVRLHVGGDLGEPAERLPAYHDQRVDQHVQVEVLGGEQGRHRVDQEGHVVRDDLDHGVLLFRCRLVDAQLQLARHPLLGQVAVGLGGGEHLRGGEPDQLLVRREPPEPVDQGGHVMIVTSQRHRLGNEPFGVRDRFVEIRVLDVIGQRVRWQSQIVKGVDAGTRNPALDPRAVAVVVARGIEVVVPAGIDLPEIGLRKLNRRTPVHRCHSPRPTALWVTLRPAYALPVRPLIGGPTHRTSGSRLRPFTPCGYGAQVFLSTPTQQVITPGSRLPPNPARNHHQQRGRTTFRDRIGDERPKGGCRHMRPYQQRTRATSISRRRPVVAALVGLGLVAGLLTACSGSESPEQAVDAFLSGWQDGKLDQLPLRRHAGPGSRRRQGRRGDQSALRRADREAAPGGRGAGP